MVWVKICGITRIADAMYALEAGADAIGLVVGFPHSPRNISIERAKEIRCALPRDMTVILVTNFYDRSFGIEACNHICPDGVQAYGDITPDMLDELGIAFKIKPISYHQVTQEDLKGWDAILLDSSMGKGLQGDWISYSKIARSLSVPVIIAGGLNAENVEHVVKIVKPFGVDVSSGVELSPGVKDRGKVIEFVKRAKSVI